MTQGSDGISFAHRAALGCLAVARQLSVVALVVLIAALVAGTAGTSYAKGKKKPARRDGPTEDTVVVTNFGSLFAGSIETFAAGSVKTSGPTRWVKGPATLLGAGNGASGDAQSSLDGDIAVTVPFGVPGLCPAGCVGVWSAGATGNSAPEEFIGGPAGFNAITSTLNNNTGLFLNQGAAFNNPFREPPLHNASGSVLSTPDQFAIANFGQVVVGSMGDFEFCGGAFGGSPTIGTITEYLSGPGNTGNIAPTPNVPVFEAPFPPNAGGLPTPFISNATIGGCDTALLGPVGLAFDEFGDLFVVNEGLAALGPPFPKGFVTEYAPGVAGDAAPINIIGLLGTTAGAFIDPVYIAVSPDGGTIFVTDVGDNSIKIFDTSPAFSGTQTGTIKGGLTKLFRPEGIALFSDDDLYVVSNNANSLLMFDDFTLSGGNISPKAIIKGVASKMNFPVGVALPQFSAPL